MIWTPHSELKGLHSFMSPSQGTWLDDSDEQFKERWKRAQAVKIGTALHEHAANCITYKTRLEASNATLNSYVNDAIGFGMTPEQPLLYSRHCFGTADSISFDERSGRLRIHDLKTGITPAHFRQLRIYAALFCLEYNIKPSDLEIILSLYQNDDISTDEVTGKDILKIEKTIQHKSKLVDMFEGES